VALLLALLVSSLIAAYVARRIRRISAAAEAIAAGDFSRRLADGAGDEIGHLAGSVDEMRRKLASAFASLSGERERLARVLDRLEEGVIAVDGEGVVQLANPAAVALLDGTVVRGRRLPDVTPASDLTDFARSAARGRCAPEAEIRTDQGRILRVQAADLGGDRADDVLIVLSDRTTDRRREEVEQRFVANASHELRTPLAAIVAAVEVLQDGAKDDPEAADTFLEDISRHARRLERLADTLLTLARLGTGELRPELHDVDAGVVVSRVGALMGSLAAAGGITIETHGDAVLRADEDLVEQVVIGLVGNAVKHTPRGGRITISADAGADTGSITVADTGSGIDSTHLPRVFEQFWRADVSRTRGGFGLGLAIGREFISAMGGTLTVASEPGLGTTVTILLPVARAAATSVPVHETDGAVARAGD
jgi:signal transduction histidine kinase